MKRTPPLEQQTTIYPKQFDGVIYRRRISKGLALGLTMLAACILLIGGLLYGQGSGDVLFINNNGNVGIGTSDPKAALDVNGTIKAQNVDVKGKVNTQDLKAGGTVEAKKFEGDGSSLTVGDGNLRQALDKKFDKAGGQIDGNVLASKVYSGNACEERTAQNEVSTKRRDWEDVPGMDIIVTTGNRPLFILFVVSESWVTDKTWAHYRLLLDGKEIGKARNHYVSRHSSVVILRMPKVPEGRHTIKAQWNVDKGEAKSLSLRTLTVIEQ